MSSLARLKALAERLRPAPRMFVLRLHTDGTVSYEGKHFASKAKAAVSVRTGGHDLLVFRMDFSDVEVTEAPKRE